MQNKKGHKCFTFTALLLTSHFLLLTFYFSLLTLHFPLSLNQLLSIFAVLHGPAKGGDLVAQTV